MIDLLALLDEAALVGAGAGVAAVASWARTLRQPITWPDQLTFTPAPDWATSARPPRPPAKTYVTAPIPRSAHDVPVAVLTWLADPAELAAASRNRDRVALQQARRRDGIVDPVHVSVDQRGRAAFTDGHHRLAGALADGVDHLATTVLPADRLPGWGRPVTPLIQHLLVGAPLP